MIRTEAFEAEPTEKFKEHSSSLPTLRFDLELVQFPNGKIEWVESEEDYQRLLKENCGTSDS